MEHTLTKIAAISTNKSQVIPKSSKKNRKTSKPKQKCSFRKKKEILHKTIKKHEKKSKDCGEARRNHKDKTQLEQSLETQMGEKSVTNSRSPSHSSTRKLSLDLEKFPALDQLSAPTHSAHTAHTNTNTNISTDSDKLHSPIHIFNPTPSSSPHHTQTQTQTQKPREKHRLRCTPTHMGLRPRKIKDYKETLLPAEESLLSEDHSPSPSHSQPSQPSEPPQPPPSDTQYNTQLTTLPDSKQKLNAIIHFCQTNIPLLKNHFLNQEYIQQQNPRKQIY